LNLSPNIPHNNEFYMKKERKLDFLSRRPVRAMIIIQTDKNDQKIAGRLPSEYLLENGLFRFPAGYWESYFVNGREYNVEGNRSLKEQQELITKDLSEEGFTKEEIEEFILEIETREGRPMLLTLETSNKWLRYHPEFEKEALRLLGKIKNEIQGERESELTKHFKK
jgi:hypothetical protein